MTADQGVVDWLRWQLLKMAVRFYVAPWRKGRFILTFDWDKPLFLVTGKTESADVPGHFDAHHDEEGSAR